MNRRYKRIQNSNKLKEAIIYHIQNNLKEYLIVSIILFIGIIIGVIFINKASDAQKEGIVNYISSFILELNENKNINEIALLIDSMKKNILLAVFLWFIGSTIIGIPIVCLTILFRGFCLGYTVSSIILTIRNTEKVFCL